MMKKSKINQIVISPVQCIIDASSHKTQNGNIVKFTEITNFILHEFRVVEFINENVAKTITSTIAAPPDGNPINLTAYSSVNHTEITFY